MQQSQSAKTAVVVDDEPIVRMDFADILTGGGYRVVAQCSDGFDAVEACRAHQPDVVLMDIKMPVFDGLSAAETILTEDAAGCVVILTAFDDAAFLARAKAVGVSGYLTKPVEARVLLPTIEMALAQSARLKESRAATQALEAKMAEKDLIDRAKRIVAKRDNVSESEAYARIQKMGMDRRCPMAEVAALIVETGDGRRQIDKAKAVLMARHGLAEEAAYKKLKTLARQQGCDIEEAARRVAESG